MQVKNDSVIVENIGGNGISSKPVWVIWINGINAAINHNVRTSYSTRKDAVQAADALIKLLMSQVTKG